MFERKREHLLSNHNNLNSEIEKLPEALKRFIGRKEEKKSKKRRKPKKVRKFLVQAVLIEHTSEWKWDQNFYYSGCPKSACSPT